MKDGLYVNKNNKVWWLNGQRHREDGPAVEWAYGDKEWWLNGELHRDDGPALEYTDGHNEWYLHGAEYTEDQFILKTSKFWQQVVS